MNNAKRKIATLSTTSTATTVILLVALIVLILAYDVRAAGATQVKQMGTPDLETFATYDDMRRYFSNRNMRSLRYLDNPEDDSYIDAFNKHNEQPALLDIEKLKVLGQRAKRATEPKTLPTEPKILKFEISDAVEPSDELKKIIRQHRSEQLKKNPSTTIKKPRESVSSTSSTSSTEKPRLRKVIRTSRKQTAGPARERHARSKRSTLQQPANFKVKLIPFSIEDAKEPDEATKNFIKQMRALDLERSKNETPARAIRQNPAVQSRIPRAKTNRLVKLKRSRRSTINSQPEMFKFEIEDAKEPDDSMKMLLKKQISREGKTLRDGDLHNSTTKATESRGSPTKDSGTMKDLESGNENNGDSYDNNEDDDDDQNGHESRRFYMYKEAPKTRKSINSLPHEVQKVITHLLKEHDKGKAHLKYIPTDQMDYGHLKALYQTPKIQQPIYGAKLRPVKSFDKHQPLVEQVEPVKIQAVPVVEKIRYVYTPVIDNNAHYPQSYGSPNQLIQQPIVVKETAAPPTEVYHSYAADLSRINYANHNEVIETKAQVIKDVPAPQFKPSKPDPILNGNKLAEEYVHGSPGTQAPVEHLKYEILSYGTAPQNYYHNEAKPHIHLLSQAHPELEKHKISAAAPTPSPPVIKIEYHASADAVDENYKSRAEYKELSALMGKSPEDQIHSLTYLLAKEMQNKIFRQSKQLDADKRPQDSTSPILFHPKQQTMLSAHPKTITTQSGRLLGLGKMKEYVPIVEETSVVEPAKAASIEQFESAKLSSEKEQTEEQFLEYGGLSPNYELSHAANGESKFVVQQLINHAMVTQPHHHSSSIGHHSTEVKHGPSLKMTDGGAYVGLNHGDHNDALQYASKYAFGYRIRDFHTGNDFGHKQNRDLDGVTRGQYHILLPDGRIQNVIYHADDTGFHADVSFESGH